MYTGIARLARLGPVLGSKARVDYTELPTRRYFNRCSSPRLPFAWTLNPFRGCEFGCVYCYARYTHEFRWTLGLTTKGGLVARDAALLAAIGRRHSLSVAVTITTVDTRLARLLEPMAPRPDLRLKAVAALAQAGVRVGVYASPALPGINDSERSLDAVARMARAAGAVAFGAQPVFLTSSARQLFLPFLDREFPRLARAYRARFHHTAYLRGDYPEVLKGRIHAIRALYDLASRVVEKAPPWLPPQLELFP
jgi:DNA repair photolyase